MSSNHFDQYFNEVNNFFLRKDKDHIDTCYLCGEQQNSSYQRIHGLLYKCKACGFVWLANQPTLKVLDEFYKQSEAMTTWSKIKGQGLDDERQDNKYEFFWQFIADQSLQSVLDVGCGTGYFLAGIDSPCNRKGVEPNADSARHCSAPIVDPNNLSDTFDLVTFFGVLEHLKDPRGVLKHYDQFVNPNGYIGVIVPNISSLAFEILGEQNCSICPQHLWYFNINSLCRLFDSIGYELNSFTTVETEYQPICRKLLGINPYNKLGGYPLGNPAISEDQILKLNLGAKVCALFKKNHHTQHKELHS